MLDGASINGGAGADILSGFGTDSNFSGTVVQMGAGADAGIRGFLARQADFYDQTETLFEQRLLLLSTYPELSKIVKLKAVSSHP